MIRFARLLEQLLFTPQRNTKIHHLAEWFQNTPMPDRGWGLAALVGEFQNKKAKPALIRAMASTRIDAELFAISYDFVGDLAETVALIWPDPHLSPNSTPPDIIRYRQRIRGC
jgi:DNA ligase-1